MSTPVPNWRKSGTLIATYIRVEPFRSRRCRVDEPYSRKCLENGDGLMADVNVTDDHTLRMDQLRLADLVTGRLDGGSGSFLTFTFPGPNAFRGDFTGDGFSFDLSTGTVREIRVVYNHVGTTFITHLSQPLTDFVRWGTTSDEISLRATIFSWDDNISGASFDDYLIAYAGNDALSGGSGSDTLEGGDGNDTLDGGADDDQLSGGAGSDIYYTDSPADIVSESVNSGTDTVIASISYTLGSNVENLTLVSGALAPAGTGNDLDNVIIGNDAPNALMGGKGADNLDGGDGNDHIYGFGLTGDTSADGSDLISGGNGGDYIQGNAGRDSIEGGAGSDRIYGGADNDQLQGGDGNDSINGNKGDDVVRGDAGNDALRGGQGNDVIVGDNFYAYLTGSDNDMMMGDEGNDTIQSMGGYDIVTGGNGSDLFAVYENAGAFTTSGPLAYLTYTITDFQHGIDHITLGVNSAGGSPGLLLHGPVGTAFTGVAAALAYAQQQLIAAGNGHFAAALEVGSDAYLFYNSSATITIDRIVKLENFDASTLDANDLKLSPG